MFPGITSKLSESTLPSATVINPKTDVVLLTGTTTIQTIVPNFGGGFSGILFLIPLNGNIDLGVSGNILGGPTILQNFAHFFIYSRSQGKWHPESGL